MLLKVTFYNAVTSSGTKLMIAEGMARDLSQYLIQQTRRNRLEKIRVLPTVMVTFG
jgi:hypothetical protein